MELGNSIIPYSISNSSSDIKFMSPTMMNKICFLDGLFYLFLQKYFQKNDITMIVVVILQPNLTPMAMPFLKKIALLSLLNWVTFSCNAKLASSYKKEG